MGVQFHCLRLLVFLLTGPTCDPDHVILCSMKHACLSVFGVASVNRSGIILGAECKVYSTYFQCRRLSFSHDGTFANLQLLFKLLHYFYTLFESINVSTLTLL